MAAMTWATPLILALVITGAASAALAVDAGPSPAPKPGRGDELAREATALFAVSCLSCHGAERPKGGLRLDDRAALLRGGEGGPAIVPGRSADSLLLRRVRTETADAPRMPVKKAALTTEQIALLTTWIDAGAPWPAGGHWAWTAPRLPAIPVVRDQAWVRNPIDAFVLARLERDGLRPAPEAPPATLIRRLSLDLIGLPPTPEEVDTALADSAPDAWNRQIDRLLASPHHGERWATPWLDGARYGDSAGRKDATRSVWKYRDWVIDALNHDLPYDRFTIQQIAGDLLPNATVADRIATGFSRNSVDNAINDKEEERWYADVDRTNTLGTVWLGLTVGCAQCHDHKYDPIPQRDYYRLLAFFAQAEDQPLAIPLEPAVRSALDSELQQLDGWALELAARRADEVADWEAHAGKAAAKTDKVLAAALSGPAAGRDRAAKLMIAAAFLATDPDQVETVDRLRQVRRQVTEAKITTLVLAERKVLKPVPLRIAGSYSRPGEIVEPGVPTALGALPAGAARNRLGLAQWLVDGRNPLTARVAVNRIWAQHFGRGLVETAEDFGSQGRAPSHSDLLDWLACEFVAQGWSMKALHRLITGSATWRQSSARDAAAHERDGDNRLLARGARFRLSGETLRDQALSIGGLLDRGLGGPPVFPPLPAAAVDGAGGGGWKASTGRDQWRRSIYVFWKRAALHPVFGAFDAPSREFCVVRRTRTTTPLQALTMLNEPQFVAAARGLARRMIAVTGTAARIDLGWRMCLARLPVAAERAAVTTFAEAGLRRYRADPAAAALLNGGEPLPAGSSAADLAAWTLVANVLLNLDATQTQE